MYFTRQAQDDALKAFWDKKNKEFNSPKVLVKIRDDAPVTSIGGKFGPIYRGGEARWEPKPFAEYWQSQGWVDILDGTLEDQIDLAKIIISKKGTVWNGRTCSINERLTVPLTYARTLEESKSAKILDTFKSDGVRLSA